MVYNLNRMSAEFAEEPETVCTSRVINMPYGRRGCDFYGCKAVALDLPAIGATYPVSTRKGIVIVGGESGQGKRRFIDVPVFDVDSGEWRSHSPVPPMELARTAVALCVGLGRV